VSANQTNPHRQVRSHHCDVAAAARVVRRGVAHGHRQERAGRQVGEIHAERLLRVREIGRDERDDGAAAGRGGFGAIALSHQLVSTSPEVGRGGELCRGRGTPKVAMQRTRGRTEERSGWCHRVLRTLTLHAQPNSRERSDFKKIVQTLSLMKADFCFMLQN
jgi:hypothetical protein